MVYRANAVCPQALCSDTDKLHAKRVRHSGTTGAGGYCALQDRDDAAQEGASSVPETGEQAIDKDESSINPAVTSREEDKKVIQQMRQMC